ncbi:MAG: phosphate ABC transporter substrate-binding protein [Burkholderiales bacterium]|nr:phosphate ABC transporter substrate-binding protein [Burkholderiales bacterium]
MQSAFMKAAAAVVIALTLASAHAGDVVVIVNKSNAQAVDIAFVTKVYTGTANAWPDGSTLSALDHSDDGVRTGFAAMLGKSTANLKAIWANLMFSGKGTPPKVTGGDAEVKAAVAANKGAIGYIKASAVDDSVKVVVK